MPGNGVGDRDHNFFSQENFSQGQGRFEVVERSWPMLNDNLWEGTQRQSGYSFNFNSRNATVLQSDADGGPGSASYHVAHCLSIAQSNLKPGFTGGSFQNQQTPLNGFFQGNQVFPVVQNESNFTGMDSEPDQHDFSKGFPIVNSQRGKDFEIQKIPSKMLNPEAAVNFDFLGAREPATALHSGALRFLQGQQTNVNDVQLLQQQVLLEQLQDVQRQHLHQQNIWQQSSLNQFPSVEKPGVPLNGIPVNDASNYSWQHGLGANNSNRLERGTSAVVQESPGGLMISPQHGPMFHVMGSIFQHNDRSAVGISLSKSEERSNHNSQLENSDLQRMPSGATSIPGSLFASYDQAHVQNGALVPKQVGNASHSNVRFNSDVLWQASSAQRNASAQEIDGRQTYVGYPETPERNTSSSPAPQNEATLDPTEERILFGGDDNVWGTLGIGTIPGPGAFSMTDGTGFSTKFPSVQSGSWSALMQSALAETSSDNQVAQEEWSGLSVQNAETTVQISHHNTLSDDPRQSVWSGGSMHPLSSSPRLLQLSSDGRSATVSGLSGARQSDLRLFHGENENVPTDSSPRWQLDRNHHPSQLEGSQNYVNVVNSSDSPAKRMSLGSFDHSTMNPSMHPPSSSPRLLQLSSDGRSATVLGISGARQSDLRLFHGENENVPTDSSPRWQLDRNHHPSQLEGSQNYVNVVNSSDSPSKRMSLGSFGHSTMNPSNWKASESKIAGEHLMMRNEGRENYVQTMSSRSPTLVNSGSPASHGEDAQQLSRHHGVDFWRPASSPMNFKGIPDNRNALAVESSRNNDIFERGHENKRNFTGAFRPNSASHMTAGAVRGNTWLDAGEPSNLHEGLQNQSGEGIQKPATIRKFQYHFMGNVDTDMESPYGVKQGATKPIISQARGLVHPRLIGNDDVTSISSEKADARGTEAALRGMLGYASENLSGSVLPSNKNVQSSQNMLELLHKVDQSREQVVGSRLSSSERNENNEAETSDGSVGHFQRNQFPASKGFSLQLAPPSPRLQNFNRASPSQSPLVTLPVSHSLSSQQKMGHSSFVSTSSNQSLSSLRETPPTDCGTYLFSSSGQIANKIPIPNFQGNFSGAFASGFPLTRSHPPNQLDTSADGIVGPSQSMIASSNQIPVHSNFVDTSHERAEFCQSDLAAAPNIPASASSTPSKAELGIASQRHPVLPPQQFSTSQSSTALSFPRQAPFSRVLPDAWMATSNQQHLLSAIPGNSTLGLVDSGPKYSDRVDMNSSELQKWDNVDLQNGGQGPSEPNEHVKVQRFDGENHTVKEPSSGIAGPSQSTVQGKESLLKPPSDVLHSTSGRQGKIEAFHGYLRPSNSTGNYALSHQVQVFKTSDGNLDDRAMKRLKGLDGTLESQSVALEGGKAFSSNSCMPLESSSVCGVDSEMLHLASSPGDNHCVSGASPDSVAFSKVDARGSSMAPSVFEHYGSFINGNIHNMYDARKMALLKSMQQPAIFHKPANGVQMHSSADVSQAAFAANTIGNLLNCSTPSVATGEPALSDHTPPLEARVPTFIWPTRKRKSSAPENLSWHKEVVEGTRAIQEMGEAEVEWAKACNRLPDKVDDESENIEGGAPFLKSRRRLLLSTQLMQLLLQPSPAAVLCGDAVVNVENVVYFVTRKTLGDACNWILCSSASHSVLTDDGKTISETPEVSEKNDDQHLTKAIEYLVGRTRTLANELSRLDRRFSIADLRAECQDLDKLSVINRFARFHGRGHTEVVGTPSSSDAAAILLKFCPQRYVTALPMPRNLPDRIECLSL